MIFVIDYGMGNLCSIEKALKKIDVDYIISNDKKLMKKATHIILPGVGYFEYGMKNLNKLGMIEALREEVLVKKKPLLGICLGMQLLFNKSEEGNPIDGLGFVDGNIKKFSFDKKNCAKLKIPHIGWNNVLRGNDNRSDIAIFAGIDDDSNFFFVHSYHAVLNKKEMAEIALTDYGYPFVSVVQKENIYGTQFHPEKSQKKGLKILENFASIRYSGQVR
jgi:imidazole glycerol-phosphate synthase subunit HisH